MITVYGMVLLVLLIAQEFASAIDSNRARLFARFLIVPIISMLLLLILVIIFETIEILS